MTRRRCYLHLLFQLRRQGGESINIFLNIWPCFLLHLTIILVADTTGCIHTIWGSMLLMVPIRRVGQCFGLLGRRTTTKHLKCLQRFYRRRNVGSSGLCSWKRFHSFWTRTICCPNWNTLRRTRIFCALMLLMVSGQIILGYMEQQKSGCASGIW